MKQLKNIFQKLLFPPLWLIIFLALVSAVALVAVFTKGWENSPVAYGSYALSAYSLTVVCLVCWKNIPKRCQTVKAKVYSHPYARLYFTDAAFKTRVNLYGSLAINLLYVAINAISAILYHTAWFGIFALYYAVMAVMRFLLVRYMGHHLIGQSRIDELKRARLCACILMTVNLILSGALLMMVHFGRGFEYRGMLIYVMAAYTFYITIASIVDIVRYRKYNSPVLSASKVIRLAAALVSMLSLETAMLSQFGGDSSPQMRQTMIKVTGGDISAIIAAMALYLIIRSSIALKKLSRNHSADR